jgi:adenylosuccinate lyase
MNELICEKAGFSATGTYDISVQTYSRKVDLDVSNAIAGLGSTAIHIAGDVVWAPQSSCEHLQSWQLTVAPFF